MMSTTYVAVRQHGVCRGTLWRQEGAPSSSSSHNKNKKKSGTATGSGTAASPTSASTSSSSSSSNVLGSESTDYCVATGNILTAYESFTCYQRGDVPIRLYEIVGASSPSISITSTQSAQDKNAKSFCLVTNQGTYVYCQAVTRKCRDMWLTTLHAGLQISLLQTPSCTPTHQKRKSLIPPEPVQSPQNQQQDQQHHVNTDKGASTTNIASRIAQAFERRPPPIKSCLSCGAMEWTAATATATAAAAAAASSPKNSNSSTPSSPTTNSSIKTKAHTIIYSQASPISHYGKEYRCDLCRDCYTAQGMIHHLQFIKTIMSTAQQERQALLQARQLCAEAVAMAMETTTSTTEKAVTTTTTETEAAPTTTETTEEKKEKKDETEKKPPEEEEEENEKEKDASAESNKAMKMINEVPPLPETTTATSMITESTEDNEEDDEEDKGDTNQEEEAKETATTQPSSSPSSPQPAEDKSSDGSNESWTHVETTSSGDRPPSPPLTTRTTKTTAAASTTQTNVQQQQQPDWIHVAPSSASSTAILELVQDKQKFGSCTRVSPFLEMLVDDLLLQGRIGVADFLEQLEEAVAQTETDSLVQLKKQAFRVAGDMGTAMKLLVEHALPNKYQDLAAVFHHYDDHIYSNNSSHAMSLSSSSITAGGAAAGSSAASSAIVAGMGGGGGTETLACLLEFFLDLCEEGELSAVSFFWPQLCHLHLCMLPAENAAAVARVDLVEDFLLTVATRFSIHLALELIWSHTADLEESLDYHPESYTYAYSTPTPVTPAGSGGVSGTSHGTGAGLGGPSSGATATLLAASCTTPCAMSCRRRRFSVLRFVCELESMLFGHENGWGGGSVALGKMLIPTLHQQQVMKDLMMEIQEYRREAQQPLSTAESTTLSEGQQQHSVFASRRLSRSARLDMLAAVHKDIPPEELAEEKLRIARNADYFSGHLNFTKRICDIAEKLRFMDLSDRATALEEELVLLNSSGAMGGDPLNRISSSFVRVVRVPTTEGHVFRSKERTPVLLLMEVVDEAAEPPRPETLLAEKRRQQRGNFDATAAASEGDDANSQEAERQKGTSDGQKSDDSEAAGQDDVPPPPEPVAITASVNDSDDNLILKNEPQQAPLLPPPMPLMDTNEHSASSLEADVLVGSSSMPDECRPSPGALRRKCTQPLTPKREVEKMVNSARMTEMLREKVGLPDLGIIYEPQSPERPSSPAADISDSTSSRDQQHQQMRQQQQQYKPLSPRSLQQQTRKMVLASGNSTDCGADSNNTLAPTGDVRREVLNVIMMKGKKGNSIAAGTQDSVQRSLKELERKRATELLLEGDDDDDAEQGTEKIHASDESTTVAFAQLESTEEKLASLGLKSLDEDDEPRAKPSEEDEVMEAVRLLLIQNRVAQGHLTPSDAAKVLQHISLSRVNSTNQLHNIEGGGSGPTHHHHPADMPIVDAGDLDPRLAGCGPLPPAVLQALTMWKGDMVTHGELLELVKKDIAFVKHSVLLEAESVDKLNEDSAFWGRFAFGERWAEKKSRILASSPQGSAPGWDLVGVIVKSNDDLRQEAFVMQLIELCQEAFKLAGLELWVNPYRILATGRNTGIIEMVRNAMSFDALKKRPGYGKGGLREHLQRMTEFTADPGGAFKSAQRNFVRSLAAYSLMSYFFLFKDRHNGNLLLDTAGHVIHIDFGFVFGNAPGGSFSLESYTPFKLTEEMLEVMGGLRSPLFSEFVTLFCCGFLALQSYCDTFLTLVEITSRNSTFPCFVGKDASEIVSKLRERFCPDLSKEDTVAFALDLIKQATTSYGTRQYDLFQYLSQGIAT